MHGQMQQQQEHNQRFDIAGIQQCEKFQRKVGKIILGVSTKTTNEVVLGELGWWRMKARRDMARLVFWRKLIKMNISRIAKKIYIVSRGKNTPWIPYTQALLHDICMKKEWRTENVSATASEWRNKIKNALYVREEKHWKQNMSLKTKLDTYRTLKFELSFENYLLIGKRT